MIFFWMKRILFSAYERMQTALTCAGQGSERRKSSPEAIFSDGNAPFAYSPTARRAANGVRKALLRKATEPTAQVAGLGTRVGGLRPSDASQRVYRQPETSVCAAIIRRFQSVGNARLGRSFPTGMHHLPTRLRLAGRQMV